MAHWAEASAGNAAAAKPNADINTIEARSFRAHRLGLGAGRRGECSIAVWSLMAIGRPAQFCIAKMRKASGMIRKNKNAPLINSPMSNVHCRNGCSCFRCMK